MYKKFILNILIRAGECNKRKELQIQVLKYYFQQTQILIRTHFTQFLYL